MHTFQHSGGNEAAGPASAGRGKLAFVPGVDPGPPMLRLACRDAHAPEVSEQELLAHIGATFAAAGFPASPALIANYYVSLKTNPFVILTGAEGYGKLAFAQLFAEALVGSASQQYAQISGGAAWLNATGGEDNYFRTLHERFCSMRFLELLQEAAAPANTGKTYLICFNRLHPDELEHYFGALLRVTPSGQKRLNLPGVPDDQQPVVPPNVFITATVNTVGQSFALSRHVLRHAGMIEFRASLYSELRHRSTPPSPAGYQRLWLNAAIHSVPAARERLNRILGPGEINRLRCSPDLARLLWRAGIALTGQTLQELTTYVANSFDLYGRGLYDPRDALGNASIAFDAQVIQRVLWRLRDSDDLELRSDLADYLDRLTPLMERQAVA